MFKFFFTTTDISVTEVTRLLEDVRTRVANGETGGAIRDSIGNIIGSWGPASQMDSFDHAFKVIASGPLNSGDLPASLTDAAIKSNLISDSERVSFLEYLTARKLAKNR
jgi:hypothetical protein